MTASILPLAVGAPGPTEVLLIFLAIILLFGASRLPGLARALGRSLHEFKKGRQEGALDTDEPAKVDGDGQEKIADKSSDKA